MDEPPNARWTEDSSQVYQELASVAVPARAEQIAVLLTLLPFKRDADFRVVELASGEGYLSAAILTAFPNASVLALDGSETMRQSTAERLQPFAGRFAVGKFDITASDWHPQVNGANAVLSSLCVHHLTHEGKQRLFQAMQQQLSEQGVLLIADLVQPQHEAAQRLFADSWDHAAEEQSITQTGNREAYEAFLKEDWNYYRFPNDAIDHPSPLSQQLDWLKTAGFVIADCFWMKAGHAIYGGYQSNTDTGSLSFGEALKIVQNSLH